MLPRFRSLWRNLRHRGQVDRELDEELRAVRDLLVDEKIRAGLPPDAARRAAAIEFGHIDVIKDYVGDVRAGAVWDGFVQDVRYGARMLRRNPAFTVTASLSLAICLGANTAVFTLANRLLFREPPGVAEPDALTEIAPTDGRKLIQPMVPYPTYAEIRDRATTLAGVYGDGIVLQPLSMRETGPAERIFATFVTSNYFSVLRVRPAVGRLFASGDGEGQGANPIVVLSHAFWKRRFNADPAIVGRALHLNGHAVTVTGVAAQSFGGLSFGIADAWLPAWVASALTPRGGVGLVLGGRLRPDVSFDEAAAQIETIGRTLQARPPARPVAPGADQLRSFGLRLTPASPIPPLLRTPASAVLALLMGVVALVLAIACANIAGVLLARGTARRREIAVRLALGAPRGRLVRQLLTETALLFFAGGTAGMLLATLLTSLLVLLVPALPVPVDLSLAIDARVIAFTTVVALATAVLSGLVPARHASRADVLAALKADSQGPSDRLRLRSAFVVAQIACSLVLVVAAGLLVRAMHRVSVVDVGFESEGVEVAALNLSLGSYTEVTGPLFVKAAVERIQALSGVESATAAAMIPDGGQTRVCCGVMVPGVTPPQGERYLQPSWNFVQPKYFATLRIPLVAGRDFSDLDRRGAEPVTIVSAAAARQYWPGEDPVGKYVLWHAGSFLKSSSKHADEKPSPLVRLSVIGVAGDVKTGSAPQPVLYVPFPQRYQSDVSILARGLHGRRLAAEIAGVVASIDPNLPIVSSQPLNQYVGPVQLQLRVSAGVSAAVGAVGMLLAAIGIYGVTAYSVTRRTREIGVRLAMGARRSDVMLLVLRQGMTLVLIGSFIGLFVAALSSRLLVRLLFGVPPLDPVTFGVAAVLLAAVGLTACYLPARRATRISAVEALRYE